MANQVRVLRIARQLLGRVIRDEALLVELFLAVRQDRTDLAADGNESLGDGERGEVVAPA